MLAMIRAQIRAQTIPVLGIVALLGACQAAPPAATVPTALQTTQAPALTDLAATLRGSPGDETPAMEAIALPAPRSPVLVVADLAPLAAPQANGLRLATMVGRLGDAVARSPHAPVALLADEAWTGNGHAVNWRLEIQAADGSMRATHGVLALPATGRVAAAPRVVSIVGQPWVLRVSAVRQPRSPHGASRARGDRFTFPAEMDTP